ncbi:MAG: gluconate 2-dehydrogenase subunit 3 family protein [Planctomycetota bacterium]
MRITRRTFVEWGLALGSGALGLLGLGCRSRARRQEPPPGPIPPDLDAVLEAAASRMLPSDDGPGAREAGTMDYLRAALELPIYRAHRARLLDGARRLEATARRDWGSGFTALDPADQDRVLIHLQAGREDDGGFDGGRFVHDLLSLSLEGFLGDPRHGGNRGEAGWEFIGYRPGGPRSCGQH